MQVLIVVPIVAAAWVLVLVVVVAMCKAAQAGDRAEAGAPECERQPMGAAMDTDLPRSGKTARRSARPRAKVAALMRWSS